MLEAGPERLSLCLLKTPKGRESLEIFAPPPYRRGHGHGGVRFLDETLGVRSGRLLMVIAQEPTQSLATLHRPLAVDVCIAREQQDVVLALMIALSMVTFDVFAPNRPPRRHSIASKIYRTASGNAILAGDN